MKNLDKLRRKKLGELLIDEGLVTSDQVVEALKEQKRSGCSIGDVLISFGIITEWDVAATLANQLNLPFVFASRCRYAPEIKELIPVEVLHRYQCVPLDRFGRVLTVAIAGLIHEKMVEELENLSGCELFLFVGLSSDVRTTLKREFPFEEGAGAGTGAGGAAGAKAPKPAAAAKVERGPASKAAARVAAEVDEWQRLFDVANESVLSEIQPTQDLDEDD